VSTYHAFAARLLVDTASASGGAHLAAAHRRQPLPAGPPRGLPLGALPRARRVAHGPGEEGARARRRPGRARREPAGHAGVGRRPHRTARRCGGAAEDGGAARRRGTPADRPRRPGHGVPPGQARARRARLRRPDPPRGEAGRRASGRRGGRARAVRRGDARRVPGHVHRAAPPARLVVRPGAPRDGGRRPLPGHLRLARRQRAQHRRLPAALPRGRLRRLRRRPALRWWRNRRSGR
jgi:hypothetical protein